MLYPSTSTIDVDQAERRTIPHSNHKIEVICKSSSVMTPQDKPEAYVLEFCGNAARAEYVIPFVAKAWSKHKVDAWVMNYPGFGSSDGPARLNDIPGAALAAYDELARVANGRPIFVTGWSLGSAVALYVAAKRPVAGLVLRSPPALQYQIMLQHGWWNLWLLSSAVTAQVPIELDSTINARLVKAPAVFVLTGNDSIVPISFQRLVLSAYAGEKHVIELEKAGHNAPITGDDFKRLQDEIDWLWKSNRGDAQNLKTAQ